MVMMVATFTLGLFIYYFLTPGDIQIKETEFKDDLFELPKLEGVSKSYIEYLIRHSSKLNYLVPIRFYLSTPSKVYNLSGSEVSSLNRYLNKKEDELFFNEWKKSEIAKFKLKKQMG